MTLVNGNGNGIWKWVAGLLAALILGYVGAKIQEPKDYVQQKELSLQILVLQNKIDAQTNEIATIKNDQAAMRARLDQQATDLTAIATKMSVTTRPIVTPSSLIGGLH